MARRIAIVGGNGFVGRHLVSNLAVAGDRPVALVRSEAGRSIVESRGGDAHRVEDLTRESTRKLGPVLAGCDAVVYTASVSAESAASDRTEPLGLRNVIAACRDAGVPRIAFLSGLGIAHYGQNRHCTNGYFLAKMAGEVELFRSGLAVSIFRPSYIFGPGDEFLTPLLERTRVDARLSIPGDGSYRLQPISVHDAARAIVGAITENSPGSRVIDLVGPEVVSYRNLIERISAVLVRPIEILEQPIDEALVIARERGYFGLRPHDLACLLCDEISEPAATERLVGRSLENLRSMIAETDGATESVTNR
jgi:uncharacterized protein YbjT (DUF2867 family)